MKLDAGSIKVFGQQVKSNEVNKTCNRIGYMPQETALVGGLTVKETIFYFGNIFQMTQKILTERFEAIKFLLELPADDFVVEKCSGGEQRRISFAAAIIHEPDLLILDEPTVGLDSLLREKIWDFLINATCTSSLSVLITTHYSAEVLKADRVGVLRNGKLILEDSPINILASFNTNDLDDAILQACLGKKSFENISDEQTTENEVLVTQKNFLRWKIVRELVLKNFRIFKRNPM